ncbi:MAG: riboflavin synthase, partial [bacterium]
MFTGLIEEIGVVKEIQTRQGALRFAITAHEILTDLTVDDSIAINGVCLTAIKITDSTFEVEAVEETLRKTTLGVIRKGTRLNLERSLCFSDRLGGHLVHGHVYDVGQVTSV